MIKYNVSVNWLDFEFYDGHQAIMFAKLAGEHLKKDNPRISIEIEFNGELSIDTKEIIEDDVEEEEEEEEEKENVE